MSDILLVKPPEGNDISSHPPIGLWAIRSNAPWPRIVTIWDAHRFPEAKPDGHYDVVGFSLQFATQEEGFWNLLPWARDRAKKVVLGGPYGSSLNAVGVERVKGDGESYFGGKSFPVNNPALFNREELEPYWASAKPHASMSKTSRWLPIETSRGCINHCGFCYGPDFWGPYRSRTVEQVQDYLSYIKHRGVEEVFIEDDAINASTPRFLGILDALKARKLYWSCPNGLLARPLLKPEVLRSMEGSRCWRLSLPFETGSERTAKLMNLGEKWMPLAEAKDLTAKLHSLGIITSGAFVIGWPGETEDDLKLTEEFIFECGLDDVHIHIAQPFAGTPLLAYVTMNGWLRRSPDAWVKPSIETPWLGAERVAEIRARLNTRLHEAGM